jgi:wyosine [tRNA(Phe)-imidazoG37] synthetase (radical SAM superfamily)
MIAFGPVPSRRLGYSLGINHIFPKHCPYSCVYCQVGRTTSLKTVRREFFPVERIIHEVEVKITESASAGREINFLTLVPDGEPTLDSNLVSIIKGLKTFGIHIAVISNASLIDREEVQQALSLADWVSLKVDAVSETDWRQINRPNRHLSLHSILRGIQYFRDHFQGEIVTETMLVSGLNDSETAIQNLASYLKKLSPNKAYLSIPTRPPAESWVMPPDVGRLEGVLATIAEKVPCVDLLFEAEESDFISTGNIAEDILSITAVHPLREAALREMVSRAGSEWGVVEELIYSGKLNCFRYRDERFFVHFRTVPSKKKYGRLHEHR